MSLLPFSSQQAVTLTSTTASQTTTVPAGFDQILISNAGANAVWLAWGASITAPVTGTWTPGLICAPSGSAQVLACDQRGGSLSYIATTAGGELDLAVGYGI